MVKDSHRQLYRFFPADFLGLLKEVTKGEIKCGPISFNLGVLVSNIAVISKCQEQRNKPFDYSQDIA